MGARPVRHKFAGLCADDSHWLDPGSLREGRRQLGKFHRDGQRQYSGRSDNRCPQPGGERGGAGRSRSTLADQPHPRDDDHRELHLVRGGEMGDHGDCTRHLWTLQYAGGCGRRHPRRERRCPGRCDSNGDNHRLVLLQPYGLHRMVRRGIRQLARPGCQCRLWLGVDCRGSRIGRVRGRQNVRTQQCVHHRVELPHSTTGRDDPHGDGRLLVGVVQQAARSFGVW